MKSRSILAVSFALALASMASAQVSARRENQQDRIAQGVQSGQLTAGETTRLEGREANLNKEIRRDKTANGGALTAAEKAQVNQQQNRLSNSIAADKRNANEAKFGNGVVGQRRENQQDRIAQGIKNGSLTAGQTAHLEKQQQNINGQIHADRQADGSGKLTAAQHAQINRAQNRASRNIYAKKHS